MPNNGVLIFVAYDGPLQYAMFQTNTEGPYAERKNSEGTINGKFIINYLRAKKIYTYNVHVY